MDKTLTCCFFGHKDSPALIKCEIEKVIQYLIEQKSVKQFYVGTHGSFDSMVYRVLKEIKKKYSFINYNVVLAYVPGKKGEYTFYEEKETLLPNGIEAVPKKFGIDYRNKWMLKQSEFVVCYITHSYGGASKYVEMAKKQKKKIINIANLQEW